MVHDGKYGYTQPNQNESWTININIQKGNGVNITVQDIVNYRTLTSGSITIQLYLTYTTPYVQLGHS